MECFSKLDYFGSEFKLTIKGNEKFGSVFGAIFSIIFYLMSLTLCVLIFRDYIDSKSIVIVSETNYKEEPINISLNNKNFFLSFGLYSTNTQEIIPDDKFEILKKYFSANWIFINKTNQSETIATPLRIEKCINITSSLIGEKNISLSMHCLNFEHENTSIYLSGDVMYDYYSIVLFSFSNCKYTDIYNLMNSWDPSCSPLSKNELEIISNYNYFSYLMPKWFVKKAINFSDKNKIDFSFEEYAMEIGNSTYTYVSNYLQKSTFTDDRNWIAEMEYTNIETQTVKTSKSVSSQGHNLEIGSRNNYFFTVLRASSQEEVITTYHVRIQDFLANIVGFTELLKFLFVPICVINDKLFQISLVNSFFYFGDIEEDLEEKKSPTGDVFSIKKAVLDEKNSELKLKPLELGCDENEEIKSKSSSKNIELVPLDKSQNVIKENDHIKGNFYEYTFWDICKQNLCNASLGETERKISDAYKLALEYLEQKMELNCFLNINLQNDFKVGESNLTEATKISRRNVMNKKLQETMSQLINNKEET